MRRKFSCSLSLLSAGGLAALTVLLWPNDAHAWGPLAHLHFTSGALEQLTMVGPALRQLLTHFSNEFLYGSLAADIIVGKNLARYADHCHNWNIGFRVLDRARSDAQKAFSFGFLSHLAVDTIAHNYYVPYKTVQGFRSRAAGHAYWELRYDQKLSPDLWRLARHVSQEHYRSHDEHLEEILVDSYVIPFSISKQMFGGLLLAARLKKWQRMSEMVAREREMLLTEEEVRECEKLAVDHIIGMLKDGPDAACTHVDPTGERNLYMANRFRLALKQQNRLPAKEVDALVQKARPAFRKAIYGRLVLPEIPDEVAAA